MNATQILENKNYSTAMLFIVFSYAFIGIHAHHLANVFLGLILVGSIPLFVVHKSALFKNPLFIILLLILLVEILSWVNSLIFAPDFASSGPKLDRLAKLYVFFFMAYWLKGKQENVIYLWLLFILGFIFTIFLNNDFTTLLELMQSGQRVDLSIKNAQWDSMLAGTSLLMSVFLFYATLKSSNTLKVKLSFLALLSLFIMLFSYLVLVTQSRQIWLGLVSIAIAGPLIYLVLNKGKNIKVVLFSLAGVALLLFLLGNSQTVQKRLSQEHETVHSLIQNQESIKMSSIGIRINSWLEAKDWIVRHPILGLDSKAIPEVIRQSDRFDESFKKQFGHLHNFFIETLVAYGFSGFLLILAMYYLIIKSISESSLKESEKKYYLLAGISFSVYWLIINNFESFNSRSLGIFTHNVIFASFYTFYITAYLNQSDKKEVL